MMDQELLAELKDLFMAEMGDRIRALGTAVNERNLPQVQHLGHKIHGAGGTYGYQTVSDLGEEVESGAKAGDWEQISTGYAKLAEWLQQN